MSKSKTMKIWVQLLSIMVTVILSTPANAQCGGSLNTMFYDTIVTGSGNDYHNLSFPKFDPTLGTLVSVSFSTQVTLKYSFQLENKEAFNINNYKVRVVREDDISSNALQTPIVYTNQQTYGP